MDKCIQQSVWETLCDNFLPVEIDEIRKLVNVELIDENASLWKELEILKEIVRDMHMFNDFDVVERNNMSITSNSDIPFVMTKKKVLQNNTSNKNNSTKTIEAKDLYDSPTTNKSTSNSAKSDCFNKTDDYSSPNEAFRNTIFNELQIRLTFENILELTPNILQALTIEQNFLQAEILSIQEFLNIEVDQRISHNHVTNKIAADNFTTNKSESKQLCSLCQKKKNAMCRICKSKAIINKKISSSTLNFPDKKIPLTSITMKKSTDDYVDKDTNSIDDKKDLSKLLSDQKSTSVLRLRLQEARDEHFFMDEE